MVRTSPYDRGIPSASWDLDRDHSKDCCCDKVTAAFFSTIAGACGVVGGYFGTASAGVLLQYVAAATLPPPLAGIVYSLIGYSLPFASVGGAGFAGYKSAQATYNGCRSF